MDDERIETRPFLCFEYLDDRFRIQRICGQSVNRFRGQRDDFAGPKKSNRPCALVRGARKDNLGFHLGGGCARTFSVCFFRNASRLLRILSSESARIAAASSAAFFAPADP